MQFENTFPLSTFPNTLTSINCVYIVQHNVFTCILIKFCLFLLKTFPLSALEPCIITKVGTLLTTISYNFLVADYRYMQHSHTELQVDTYKKCTLRYRLAALQHIPCLHSTFPNTLTSINCVYIVQHNVFTCILIKFCLFLLLTVMVYCKQNIGVYKFQ